MANMFRVLLARIAVLATDESGMSTVEYPIVYFYTHAEESFGGRPTFPRHRRYDIP